MASCAVSCTIFLGSLRVLFSVAVALIVLLVLFWLAAKLTREEDTEAAQRVRKIVPASGEGGVAGAAGPAVKAVPVRPEALKAQRPSSVGDAAGRGRTRADHCAPADARRPPAAPVVAEAAAPVAAAMAGPCREPTQKPKAAAKPKAAKRRPTRSRKPKRPR